jgi:hypothetical protein
MRRFSLEMVNTGQGVGFEGRSSAQASVAAARKGINIYKDQLPTTLGRNLGRIAALRLAQAGEPVPPERHIVVLRRASRVLKLFFNIDGTRWFFLEEGADNFRLSINYSAKFLAMSALREGKVMWKETD